jgi:hypothetical protein
VRHFACAKGVEARIKMLAWAARHGSPKRHGNQISPRAFAEFCIQYSHPWLAFPLSRPDEGFRMQRLRGPRGRAQSIRGSERTQAFCSSGQASAQKRGDLYD